MKTRGTPEQIEANEKNVNENKRLRKLQLY